MNKVLLSSLAAAFGLSVAACAGTVDETTPEQASDSESDQTPVNTEETSEKANAAKQVSAPVQVRAHDAWCW